MSGWALGVLLVAVFCCGFFVGVSYVAHRVLRKLNKLR